MEIPTLLQIQKQRANNSLSYFTQAAWPAIDPAKYRHNWHIDVIAEHLEAVSSGDLKRLIINIPPRHMKSISCCVSWPVWDWINNPQRRFLFASYAQSLSVRDTLKARRLIDSIWYQQRWGDKFQLTTDQNTKQRYDNDKGGYRIATSVDGSATGEGGDIIVIDDPHSAKGADSDTVRQSAIDWFDGTMSSRLNDPQTGAYVLIMQRLHTKDLTGHLLEKGGWTHLCLPAEYEKKHIYHCKADIRTKNGELLFAGHHTRESVDEVKASLGSHKAAGQLQQRPAKAGGNMIMRHWLEKNIVDDFPRDGKGCRYWDLAGTEAKAGSDPDWSAGAQVFYKSGQWFITGMERFRDTPLGNENRVKATASRDGRGMKVYLQQDPGQAGKSQISHYARNVLAGYSFHGHNKGQTGKVTMAEPLAAAAEAGNVFIVRKTADGFGLTEIEIETLLSEMELFPNGPHDDQVDGVTGAMNRLLEKTTKPRRAVRYYGR